MILYTFVIEDKQNRSKQAQHHAVLFYFFLGKFDNIDKYVSPVNYRNRVRTDNTITFQQNKFHIWVDNQSLFYMSTFDININWEEI